MKKLLLLIAFLALNAGAFSQDEKETPDFVKNKLGNALQSGANTLGRKFIVAFPMNEIETHGTQALDIYIASSEPAQIQFTNDQLGVSIIRNVIPDEITTLSSTTGDLAWAYESRVAGRTEEKSFTIVSDKPISVYVMNSKNFSTEGYLAIPVASWGYEYRHCSYYDFDEVREWGSGFIVMASEDGTDVEIELKGIGDGIETESGKEIGDRFNVRLDEGEIYMIKGTGTTRGQFDLTGSLITGDKPIGVISFHQRTMIPATVVRNGRDHMSSMMPPTQAWGTRYTTVEIDRGTSKGDFFRVIAKEDDTYFTARWYDKGTGAQAGFWDGQLSQAGDFQEYHPNAASSCPGEGGNNFTSIYGTSIFKSVELVNGEEVENTQKPIFVMQYSYSACWDNAGGNYDPFMFPVATTQQFTRSTIFQTPSNKSGNDYLSNFLNLIIQGDPDDADNNLALLRSVEFDGTSIVDIDASVLGNEIAEGLYWITLFPEIGPHTLEGDAAFGGYIYGFAQFDSYGWPAATAYANLGIQDTLPPVLLEEQECFTFKVQATEFRDQEQFEEEPPQVDQHISNWPTIISNNNFKIFPNGEIATHNPDLETEDWFDTVGGDDDVNLIFEVEDPTRDAELIYEIADNALNPKTGTTNKSSGTLTYFADKITVNPTPLDFGLVRIGTSQTLSVSLTSEKDEEITISDIFLGKLRTDAFEIGDDNPEFPLVLQPGEQVDVSVVYTPTEEWFDAQDNNGDGNYDADTLFFSTDCVDWFAALAGKGGENYMVITDWLNRAVPTLQNEVLSSNDVIEISNWNVNRDRPATWPLEIDGIFLDRITDDAGTVLPLDPFSVMAGATHEIDANGDFVNGQIVFPEATSIDDDRERLIFDMAQFESPVDGVFVRNVPFKSNAKIIEEDVADDTLSTWDAVVVSSDAFLTSENWSKTRVGISVNEQNAQIGQGYLVLLNSSTYTGDAGPDSEGTQIELVEVKFKNGERVGNTGADAWTSLNPETGAIGEFVIRQEDPTNPRWANHFNTFLADDRVEVGVTIYPSGADNVPNNGYQGVINIPVQFTPAAQYEDNTNNIYRSFEYTVIATVINGENTEEREGKLFGVAYLPVIEMTGDAFPQAEAVLAGTTYQDGLLEVPITNTGTNSDLYLYSIANSDNIDWTGNGDGVSDFIFDAANSDFDPRDPAMNEATPFAIPVGVTSTLRFQFSPSADEAIGEKTAFLEIRHNGDITGVEPHDDLPNRDQAQVNRADLGGWVKEVGLNAVGTDFAAIIECDESDFQFITFTNSGDEPFRLDIIRDINGNDIDDTYPWFEFYDQTSTSVVDINDFYVGAEIPARTGGINGQLQVPVKFVPVNANGAKPLADLNIEYIGNFVDDNGVDIEERTQADINLSAQYYNSKLDFGVNSIGGEQRLSSVEPIRDAAGQNFGITIDLDDDFENTFPDDYNNIQVNSIEFLVTYRNDQLVQPNDDATGMPEFTPSALVENWTITSERMELIDSTVALCNEDGNPDNSGEITVQFATVKYTLTAPAGDYLRGDGVLIYPTYEVVLSQCPRVVVEVSDVSFGAKDACVANTVGSGDMNTTDCIDNYRAIDPNVGPEYNSKVEVTTSTMKIKYDIGISHQTKIEVIDAQGNVVATPVNGFVEQGKHEIDLPLGEFNSGAYIVRVESLTYEDTKKVMVVK